MDRSRLERGAGSSTRKKELSASGDVYLGMIVQYHPPTGLSPAGNATSNLPTPLRGTLVEVKRSAWDGLLYAFIAPKDKDTSTRRRALWVPADRIVEVVLDQPMVSGGALQPVPRQSTLSDYFEERLVRDMRSAPTVRCFHYLGYVFRAWHYAPFELLFPSFAAASPVLHDAFLDPFSLTLHTSDADMRRYVAARCSRFAPPGRCIYSDDVAGVSVYAVDGAKWRTYCRNLFLIGKTFLENKLAGHDVGMYMFYVVCLHESALNTGFVAQRNARYFAGFFSWERGIADQNLACIVTLPCFQNQGLGTFMVEMSYQLAYRRGQVGTPERPLSDLGRLTYERFWRNRIWSWALEYGGVGDAANGAIIVHSSDDENDDGEAASSPAVTVAQIARATRLDEADVADTVLRMGLLHRSEAPGVRLVLPLALAKKARTDREQAVGRGAKVWFDTQRLSGAGT